jgi:hypothetical protein
MEFDLGEVEVLAYNVVAMAASPTPQYISEKVFKEAQQHAKAIVESKFQTYE